MSGSIGLQNPINGSRSSLVAIRGGMPQNLQLTDATTNAQNKKAIADSENLIIRDFKTPGSRAGMIYCKLIGRHDMVNFR